MEKSAVGENARAVLNAAKELLKEKECVLIAIDGRCASGKTTLANHLREMADCNVFHADDFYLRPEQKTKERMSEPGGNMDRERLLEEVLIPLRAGKGFFYRPYDCHEDRLKDPVKAEPKAFNIVEGSYSCHPELWEYYDLHIFMTGDKDTQLERIALRNPASFENFKNIWIPLEEKYISAFNIEKKAEIYLNGFL